MENLREQINSDLKNALKAKDSLVASVLRMLITAIRNKEISLRKGEDVFLGDEEILKVLNSEVKKRKDSIQAYQGADRSDLADKESQELVILEKYLPEQISDEEIKKIIKETIEQLGGADMSKFGQIMGVVTKQTSGRADGNKVSELVKGVLND